MVTAVLEKPTVEVNGFSIVIPVYNSGETLAHLHSRLSNIMGQLGKEYEIIWVDDNSKDNSWLHLQEISQRDARVKIIQLMRNYGQHNALLAGIRLARYEVIVTLDDDLQNPPEEIPKLVAELEQGYDVVYGTPQSEQHGLWRDLASIITKMALQGAMGTEIARDVSAFRVFRTQVREAFHDYQGPFVSIDVLLTWGTTRFRAVKVRHDRRQVGASNYTFGKLVTHALNMMTGFSTLPLQLASLIGFGLTLFGLGTFLFVICRYLIEGSSVPGFPFLASIISIFSGSQLLALGIIGEYLARIHFRTMRRPPYVIRNQSLEDKETEVD